MRVSLLLFLLLTQFCVAKSEVPSNAQLPQESLFYAAMFDRVCAAKTNCSIDPLCVQELKQKLPHWKELWDKEGMLLLGATTKLIGRPFTQKNFQVALSLSTFPSMSNPLIVNARYALQNFTNNPLPDYVFISTVYHEILHNYITSFLPKNTSLLIKYKNESTAILSHLHLFALEKAVYLQLGWDSKLKAIIEKDESLPNGDYKRAWDIINHQENYNDFITELKSFKDSKTLSPDEL